MADALGIVGDRWSFQIIREIALGVRRFDAIQRHTGAPRQILTARLRKLEQLQVLTRVPYAERPPRFEYELTEAGSELLPVLAGLFAWGEKHATPRLSRDAVVVLPTDSAGDL